MAGAVGMKYSVALLFLPVRVGCNRQDNIMGSQTGFPPTLNFDSFYANCPVKRTSHILSSVDLHEYFTVFFIN